MLIITYRDTLPESGVFSIEPISLEDAVQLFNENKDNVIVAGGNVNYLNKLFTTSFRGITNVQSYEVGHKVLILKDKKQHMGASVDEPCDYIVTTTFKLMTCIE